MVDLTPWQGRWCYGVMSIGSECECECECECEYSISIDIDINIDIKVKETVDGNTVAHVFVSKAAGFMTRFITDVLYYLIISYIL
jgi:hypothetical protein